MIGAVDECQRQRDVIGDAFLAHLVEKRETLAFGIVETASDLAPFAEYDRQRVIDIFRGIDDVETRGGRGDFRSRPPDEIAAENIGMQCPDKHADAPQRQACLDQALADFRHHLGRA